MSMTRAKLPEFPGFGVQYDPVAKPFFVSNVLEDLRRIASKEIGRTLLASINAARPRSRAPTRAINEEGRKVKFARGINVMMIPTSMAYTQSGFKMDWTGNGMEKSLKVSTQAHHNVPGCPYHPAGGSNAEAMDPMAATDGTGTVSLMRFTNAQIVTSKGEATQSFIVLAHELIHSLHHVTGTKKDTGEEDWTSGLGLYVGELMSENTFRKMFGLPPRGAY